MERAEAERQRQAEEQRRAGERDTLFPLTQAKQQAQIEDLKSRFETHLNHRELTVGREGSAQSVLDELADLSPRDPFIDQGRQRIALAYGDLARRELEQGRHAAARRWLELGESVRSGLGELATLTQQLNAAETAARQADRSSPRGSDERPAVGSGSASRVRLVGFGNLAAVGIDTASVQRFVDTRLKRQGGRLTADELQTLAEAITDHVRRRGLVAARAVVVGNSGGAALIRLAPGRLENVEVDDDFSSVERGQLRDAFNRYRDQPLTHNVLVNESFGLYQLLGVTVGLVISPGRQPGGSILRVTLNNREWINFEGNLQILSRSNFLKSKFSITMQGQGVRAPGN